MERPCTRKQGIRFGNRTFHTVHFHTCVQSNLFVLFRPIQSFAYFSLFSICLFSFSLNVDLGLPVACWIRVGFIQRGGMLNILIVVKRG